MALPFLSVVMASYNRAPLLARTLASIRRQRPSFPYEIIVVDDGSEGNETAEVCDCYGARTFRTERRGYTNPGPARNIGYRAAQGHVLVCQSDDTMHLTEDALERLATCGEREILIATVWELSPDGGRASQYTGASNRRPFFFLGAVQKSHLYAVGGDDEEFTLPGFEDDWLAARLTRGCGLAVHYRADIEGAHQWHERPPVEQGVAWASQMRDLYIRKVKTASETGAWVAASGPWEIPCASASA